MQDEFCNAVFNKGGLEFISSKDKQLRLEIYRQGIFENIRNSLQVIYPGVWRLVGEECANKLSFAFAHDLNNLPNCLIDLGYNFSEFLKQYQELPVYLSDYARYEWLKSLREEGCESIDPAALASIPLENTAEIALVLQSNVFSFYSEFPINIIEEIAFNPDAETIDLNRSPAYAIISNGEIFWIESDIWHIIDALMRGKTIAQVSSNPDNLSAAIYFLLKNRLIEKIK